MRSFLLELARNGGRIAREHFRSHRVSVTTKARNDYVSHVDHMVEDAIHTRIKAQYPDHLIIGEEGLGQGAEGRVDGPCWIIDPIDGTTNFIRGIAHFAISIAFCDRDQDVKLAVVYDPIADEAFIGERGGGMWIGSDRVYTSACERLDEALLATALPFIDPGPLADATATLEALQRSSVDFRRAGSAALDLAYVACGRLDAYCELGIWSWDTAAGELLVRAAGGAVSDYSGTLGPLLERRSIVAASSPALHRQLLDGLDRMRPWLAKEPFIATARDRITSAP
jgi:myo-inositol-1(or 4)-monophosphatase